MFAGLGEDCLHLGGEEAALVLSVEERSEGGDAVVNLDRAIVCPRLDGEHVHARPQEEIVLLVVQAQE